MRYAHILVLFVAGIAMGNPIYIKYSAGVTNETVIVTEHKDGYEVEGVFTFTRAIEDVENIKVPIIVARADTQVDIAASYRMEIEYGSEIYSDFVPVGGDDTCVGLPKDLKIVWLQPIAKNGAKTPQGNEDKKIHIRYVQRGFGGIFYYLPNISSPSNIGIVTDRNWNCVLIFTKNRGVSSYQANRDCERIGKSLAVYLRDKELICLK